MADFQGAGNPLYSCWNCRNPLAYRDDLLSKAFQTKSGPGYLFDHAMNVVLGRKEDRELITGRFTVCDIYCSKCGIELGWKYVRAFEASQRYKEGKFIVEKVKIFKTQF
ncbi:protein yippee-like At4g27740 [Diospyros lotus]|uniref:protein yippee-like At4g27740 n=1 Tax=Diospyros lotus TaxID=55363 RepID=UPI00225AC314|nr:protein yippee-like At4g27740 [Diospyros lotus]